MMIIRTHTALESLRPNSEWTVRGGIVEWLDSKQTQPTDSEIQAEIIRLQTIYDSQEYSRSRQAEYPSIEECIHAILDDDLDKYPKGDS